MNWNKEKLTFLLSVLVAVGAVAIGFLSGSSGGDTYDNLVRDPGPGNFVAREAEPIPWLGLEAGSDFRDPYLPISEWKPAIVDELPAPPTPPLFRRVPVPGHLMESMRALPMREKIRPQAVDGENG